MSNDTLVRTCTVGPSATTGERCGEPAVTTFVGRNGEVYAECIAHACMTTTPAHAPEAPAHPPTRSTRPFLLVRDGAIVGYADSASLAVSIRARRLGAKIIANTAR